MPKLNQSFPYSLEKVLDAHHYRVSNVDEFPALQNIETLHFEKSDTKANIVRTVDFIQDFPPAIKLMIPGNIKYMIEESSFDKDERSEVFNFYIPERTARYRQGLSG